MESTGASEKVSVCPGDVTKKNVRARSGKNLYGNQTRMFARDFLVENREFNGDISIWLSMFLTLSTLRGSPLTSKIVWR